jgi:hypothetical protein
MPTSARKKLVLFPPMQTFPTNVVSIASGGITSGSFAAGAITNAAFAANAIDATVLAANAVGASQFTQGAADKVWSTAARTITGGTLTTNNDKTGYSLTAGSYSIRASSSQRGTVATTAATSGTASISAVTLARIAEGFLGWTVSTADVRNSVYIQVTSTTQVTSNNFLGTGNGTASFVVPEYF